MKQNITLSQWKELTESQQVKFIDGCKTTLGVPIWESVTIGQMIEFLGNNIKDIDAYPRIRENQEIDYWVVYFIKSPAFKSGELCDALWEAVKEVLNK